MQENRISVVIPQDVQDSVIANLQAVKMALAPFVFPLSKADKKKLQKVGDKTLPFVLKGSEYAATNEEFLPKFVDLGELQKDVTGLNVVNPISKLLNQIASDVDDTRVLLGSESYGAVRSYYSSVKSAALQGNAGAKPIYDDLAKRYNGQGTVTKKTAADKK